MSAFRAAPASGDETRHRVGIEGILTAIPSITEARKDENTKEGRIAGSVDDRAASHISCSRPFVLS
jgi:hypothetical protein